MRRLYPSLVALAAVLLLAACGPSGQGDQASDSGADGAAPAQANVTQERLVKADEHPGQWMAYGRSYSEQRFSPLTDINKQSVKNLSLAWYGDFDTNLTQESTPVVVDGTLYVTTAWSKVYAFDAKTGALKWKYDPKVPRDWNVKLCCGQVNRGVAVWEGKVYLGTLDARLVAIDAESGREVFDVYTADPSQSYSITGAPRVANGLVFIGNGGAEFLMRGYISAFDAKTGELVWRWYVVPGDPSKPQENEALERAVKTWDPAGKWWEPGGGGSTWDGITYDPETNLVYVGTGNGGPWPSAIRSPAGGANLYTNCIVALNADTGEYVWHYQTTPEDSWDYDGVAQIMTADLEIDGQIRHVVMQAPKNGFFYVLDAKTGELLRAKNYVTVNWTDGLDENGYPRFNPMAHYGRTGMGFIVMPPSGGAHTWNPMAMDPNQGLVYIPTVDGTFPLVALPEGDNNPMGQKLSIDFTKMFSLYQEQNVKPVNNTYITAWDPVKGEVAWRYDLKGVRGGGTLATAGGLVFQGNSKQEFAAYDSSNGERLWVTNVQTGVVGGPASYAVDGEQYVAVAVGSGGAAGRPDAYYLSNHSRILAFKLGGTAKLPEPEPLPPMPVLDPPAVTASAEQLEHGGQLYNRFCVVCHGQEGQSRAVFPDIRYSSALQAQEDFDAIVLDGIREENGMVSFAEAMDKEDTAALREYVIKLANDAKNAPPPGPRGGPGSAAPKAPVPATDTEKKEEGGGLHGG